MKKKLSLEMLERMCCEKDLLTRQVQSIYIGGGDGSKTDPYTMDEYYTMLDSGTWSGGYIQDSEGILYGMSNVRVYSSYGSSNTAQYIEYTMTSFILSLENSGWNQVSGALLGEIPLLGGYTSYMEQELNDVRVRLLAEASKQGYSGDDSFDYVISKDADGNNKFSLVDIKTGKVIGTETINLLGF